MKSLFKMSAAGGNCFKHKAPDGWEDLKTFIDSNLYMRKITSPEVMGGSKE